MGLLLVAGLVAVVTTAALTEGLHNFLRLQPELEGGGETGKGEGGFGVLCEGSTVLSSFCGPSNPPLVQLF